ncbi:PH domain-containing protein [Roseimaritima ulvae]|uniref:Bacterial membrane flanked domain protein n=1 Tax=Roseimaritima ulvae TaxID=980254 RepID=A0A5B9QWD1_9BACT|nr:PH domain-containing protein [Roseimaritima ulvae]QEG43317.1 Bacterial membrane flanked domain protein [Roseimaritima ulvae]
MNETTLAPLGDATVEASGGPVYEGIWLVLAQWFRVPRQPPVLPKQSGEAIVSRKPAAQFISYLRLEFAIIMAVLSIAALVGCAFLIAAAPGPGLAVLLLASALLAAMVTVGLIAIRLRYDTTWYVFSDRSMRLRRGIWLIRETTITFENIQNVKTHQGPLQRLFGISNVIVETAGGGSSSEGVSNTDHQGLIEGIENAVELRDAIREKIAASRTSGLGDDDDTPSPIQPVPAAGFQPQHIAMLQEINQLLEARRSTAS